jgi:hypothetical protein
MGLHTPETRRACSLHRDETCPQQFFRTVTNVDAGRETADRFALEPAAAALARMVAPTGLR